MRSRPFSLHAFTLFFFTLWIALLASSFASGSALSLFWSCNLAPLWLVFAYYLRSSSMVYLFLAIGIISEGLWIVDWLMYAFFGFSFLSIYLAYSNAPHWAIGVSFLVHGLTVPITLFSLRFLPRVRISQRHVLGLVSLIFGIVGISYLFPYESNINCARHACVPFLLSVEGPSYFIVWSAFVIAITVLMLVFVVPWIHERIRKK